MSYTSTNALSGVTPGYDVNTLGANALAAAQGSANTSFTEQLQAALAAQGADGSAADSALLSTGALMGGSSISSMLPSLLGNVEDTRSALMLLCAMLSMGESAASGELTALLYAAISGMQSGDKSTPETKRKADELFYEVMDSDNDEAVLDKVNERVFKNTEAIPYQAWKASSAAVKSTPGKRSQSAYRAVIDQFNVETNGRYKVNKKGTGDTYCNIFVWDVTRAMGAEIPHKYNPATGAAYSGEGALNMNANRMYDWLAQKGTQFGWKEVSPEVAQQYANAGFPAVTAWKNPSAGRSGHVQVICPSKTGAYDAQKGVTVAQAGSRLSNYTYISNIFSGKSLQDVKYYVHS